MTIAAIEKLSKKSSVFRKLFALMLLFAAILVGILLLGSIPARESTFVDGVAGQIRQEMEENQIVLSKGVFRRTAADFQEPILQMHGKDTRLIVYTAELSENISLADEGWGGFSWTSTYQEAVYHGIAEYTVDLSKLTEADFMVNNEMKVLTVRIPYAALSPINILDDKTQFYDPQKGWAGPKAVELTPEEHTTVMLEIKEKMKAKLIDKDILSRANEEAKIVVTELLAATVRSVDPEFTVVVVH